MDIRFFGGDADLLVPPSHGAVPNNLIVEPLGRDDREHITCLRHDVPKLLRVQQPECEIDRSADHTVVVVVNLSGVQGHPQPDPFLARMQFVVLAQCRHQRRRQ